MTRRHGSLGRRRAVALVAALTFLLVAQPAIAKPQPNAAIDRTIAANDVAGGESSTTTRAVETFDALPMLFEPNVGQTDEQVKFVARGRGYAVFLTGDGATLALAGDASPRESGESPIEQAQAVAEREAISLKLVGAAAGRRIAGERSGPGKINYLIGKDSDSWRRNVATYEAVRYENVYPGIDAVFYGTQKHLEYDFVVAPGADPGQIRLAFEGQSQCSVADNGELILSTKNGELRQQRAAVFQEVGAGKREIEARYVATADGEVRIALGNYDRSRPLTIDPTLVFTEFLGGGVSSEFGYAVALDGSGAIYLTGETTARDFPVTPNAAQRRLTPTTTIVASNEVDAFVAKLSPDGGSIVYATYLGGSQADAGLAIAVDSGGNAIVTGRTSSSNFPVTAGALDPVFAQSGISAQGDAFVTKVSPDGSSFVYSTFLGGDGDDFGTDIEVTSDGAAIVAGQTRSADFPTTAGAFDTTHASGDLADAFVTKLAPSGTSLVFSTFLGDDQIETVGGLAVDAQGAIYIAGGTDSASFPTTPGAFDRTINGTEAFVAKLASNGSSLLASTFLGGSLNDYATGLVVDGSGAPYLVGEAASQDFPTTPDAFTVGAPGSSTSQRFVSKLTPTFAALAYSSIVWDSQLTLNDVAVDSSGELVVAGAATTFSIFPTTPGAFATTPSGPRSGIVFKLNGSGSSLVYSTYVAGRGADTVSAVALDGLGRATIVGWSTSDDFPVTPGTPLSRYYGGTDAVVARLSADGTALELGAYLSGKASRFVQLFDAAYDIRVDAAGFIYVAGTTASLSFPLVTASDSLFGGTYETFVTKLSPDGSSLVYSTFLGGSGAETCGGLAIDGSGEPYVAGSTDSIDFPITTSAFQTEIAPDPQSSTVHRDGYVTKLAADGSSLVYSTYLGGRLHDDVTGLAIRNAEAVVTGTTLSDDFAVSAGAFDTTYGGGVEDAFVASIAPDGSSLVFSTYLGDAEAELGTGVAVDSAGAVWVVGQTFSPGFPTTGGAFDAEFGAATGSNAEAYVAKVAPDGSTLLFSSFLGGSDVDTVEAIAVDADDAVSLGGWTFSLDLPVTPGAYDTTPSPAGELRGLVAKVSANGSLAYSTYFNEVAIRAIAVSPEGVAFVTGSTLGGLEVTEGAWDPVVNNGESLASDAFVSGLGADGSSLVYSTYLGGIFHDRGYGLAIDAEGAVLVAGMTQSANFALSGFGARDFMEGFVAKILPVAGPPRARATAGVYDPATGAWFVKYSNESGPADAVFTFGPGGASFVPLAGDWDNNGNETPGLYDPATGTFFLKNDLNPGPADIVFAFGPVGPDVVPLVGKWWLTPTVGVYVKSTGAFFLRNSLTPGPADIAFTFGPGGADTVPLIGRWSGSEGVGVYVKSTGTFYIRNSLSAGPANLAFTYGPPNAVPVAGSWDLDTTESIGLYVPSTGAWFLRNSNSPGPADVTFTYGPPSLKPVVGNWSGL